jgi:MSHA biogenesis protein MshI
MKFFTRSKKEKGWLVIDESPEEVRYVHGRGEPGGRGAVSSWTTVPADAPHAALERIAKENHFDRYQCATLLRPGEYQVVMVDAPSVPADELKSAVRWRIKDMLDYPVEDATLDVLDIPPADSGLGRAHSMFAVAAKNEVIEQRMKRFEAARILLAVIDVPETAQRNIAALYESEARGTALLHLERQSGLLTINYRGELYLTRRLDLGFDEIMRHPQASRGEVFERVQVELQRTFDHFDRQHAISVAKLVLGPEPSATGLEEFLRANLDVQIERANLAERLDIGAAGGLDVSAQWRLFHLIGASLRQEAKSL